MPKPKKRSKANPRRKRKKHVDDSGDNSNGEYKPLMSYFEHPLAQIPQDKLKEFGKALVKENTDKFDQYLDDVSNQICNTNPLALLSMASHFTLSRPVDDAKQTFSDSEYVHFASELELLHAFVLSKDIAQFKPQFVHPNAVVDILDAIKKLSSANTIRRLGEQELESGDGDHFSKMIIEQFRIDTQNVRNAGYIQQMIRVYKELLKPLDGVFKKEFGVECTQIVACFESILNECNDRTNAYFQKFNGIFEEDPVNEFIKAAALSIDAGDRVRQFVNEESLEGDQLREYLAAQILNGLFFENMWLTEELAEFLESTDDVARDIFSAISLEGGGLSEYKQEYLFLSNPVWTKPFIRMGEDQFFLMNSVHPITHCLKIIESFIFQSQTMKGKYEDRRAEYLEDAIQCSLQNLMPDAKFYAGSEWGVPGSGENGENDLLVVWNGIGIVIEAKAGKLTDEARRGAPKRMQRDIKKLLVDGAKQAHNFIDFLQESSGVVELSTKKKIVNAIKVDEIDRYVSLVVTFENLGAENACWKLLQSASLIPQELKTTLNCSVWDLDTICEILESPLELAHYLDRRTKFESQVTYLGDELDLLVTYLESGLSYPVKLEGSMIQMLDVSSRLHPYFMFREKGVEVEKPRRRLTVWFREMIEMISRNEGEMQRELAFALLDTPFESQVELESAFDEVKSWVRAAKSERPERDAISFHSSPLNKTVGVVLMGVGEFYWDRPKKETYAAAQEFAGQLFAETDYELVFVVAKHIDLEHLPYSLYAGFKRPDPS